MQFTTQAKSGKFISKYRLNTSLIQPECKQKDEELNIKTAFYIGLGAGIAGLSNALTEFASPDFAKNIKDNVNYWIKTFSY